MSCRRGSGSEEGTYVTIETKSVGGAAPPLLPGARPRPPRKVWDRRRGAPWIPYAFMAPGLILFSIFFAWPAYTAIQTSFFRYNIVEPTRFVGLDNYRAMFVDPLFWKAILNSLIMIAGLLPLTVFIPLLLALLVNKPLRMIRFYRLAYYFPAVTSTVAVAIAWNVLFQERGVINWLLTTAHMITAPVNFLFDTKTALPSIILVEGWQTMGYFMMIYLAGLQSLPSEVTDAALVDGANGLKRLWYITLPLMKPYIGVCALLSGINAVQSFTTIFVMTRGGPDNATLTLGYYIYDKAFQQFDFGYGSAMGVALFFILIGFALINNRLTRSSEVTL
jgi:putative chitobiose transport system permease protein